MFSESSAAVREYLARRLILIYLFFFEAERWIPASKLGLSAFAGGKKKPSGRKNVPTNWSSGTVGACVNTRLWIIHGSSQCLMRTRLLCGKNTHTKYRRKETWYSFELVDGGSFVRARVASRNSEWNILEVSASRFQLDGVKCARDRRRRARKWDEKGMDRLRP